MDTRHEEHSKEVAQERRGENVSRRLTEWANIAWNEARTLASGRSFCTQKAAALLAAAREELSLSL